MKIYLEQMAYHTTSNSPMLLRTIIQIIDYDYGTGLYWKIKQNWSSITIFHIIFSKYGNCFYIMASINIHEGNTMDNGH